MNIKNHLVIAFATFTLLYSCTKEKNLQAPVPILSTTIPDVSVKLGEKYSFNAGTINNDAFTSQWKLDGKVVSEKSDYTFVPAVAGTYTLVYMATNAAGTFTYSYKITVPVPVVGITASSSKYISKVFEYLPAPGQHINQASLGSPEQAQKLVGSLVNSLSLGGFGGYIIFGFDHSISDQSGADLAIYGNPFGPPSSFAEPGIVMVSQDQNGNALPDDEWFELAGSEFGKATTIKNYEITYTNPKGFANVTWTDNQGKSGVVVNSSKTRNFYPLFAANQDNLTFKGTLLPSTLSTTGFLTNQPFEWGYADSYSTGDDYKTKQYNSFDLAWAVDAAGKKVALNTVDFIKVYTAQNVNAGFLGEVSTDIRGAADLNLK